MDHRHHDWLYKSLSTALLALLSFVGTRIFNKVDSFSDRITRMEAQVLSPAQQKDITDKLESHDGRLIRLEIRCHMK